MDEPSAPIELFYSYAQSDERHLAKLEIHLAQLEHERQITSWHRQKIAPGQERAREIDAHLNTAQIILLLVSPDFLASDYCYSTEMQRALERHRAGSARVIPVLLRPTDWTNAPFSDLKALPDNHVPITDRRRNRDEAFLNVALGVRRAIQDLRTSATLQPASVAHTLPEGALPSSAMPPTTGVFHAQANTPYLAVEASGLGRTATVFLSYTSENERSARQLQVQLHTRGLRTLLYTTECLSDALGTQEMQRALEQEADVLALYLTPASLREPLLWERLLPAALQRRARDPYFQLVPLTRDLSPAALRQFCTDHQLPDLTSSGVFTSPPTAPVESTANDQEDGPAVRRLLEAACARRLQRVRADHTYEPALCLRNYAYTPPTPSLDLDLNWCDFLLDKDRLPTELEWQQILLPALRDVKEVLSHGLHSHRLHLFVQSILPVAIALGFSLPDSANFTLLLEGRHGTWSSAATSQPAEPLHCIALPCKQTAPPVAVLELSITRSVGRAVAEAPPLLGIVPAEHVRCELPGGPSQEGVESAAHAMGIARQVGRLCRKLYDQQGVQQIHLFAALPAALAVLLGHQLNALCPIALYEFSQGTYKPACTLR